MTDVKVVFKVFEIPPKSISPFSDFAQPKARHIFVIGSINTIKNLSTTFMKSTIEPFVMIAVEIPPLIVKSTSIKGINAPIILHRIFIYSEALVTSEPHMLKTVIAMHNVEQRDKILDILLLFSAPQSVLKIDIIMIRARIDAKPFTTTFIPDIRYEDIKSKKDFSSISPLVSVEKSPLRSSFGKKSVTLSGSVLKNPSSSLSIEEMISSVVSLALALIAKAKIKTKITIKNLIFFISFKKVFGKIK